MSRGPNQGGNVNTSKPKPRSRSRGAKNGAKSVQQPLHYPHVGVPTWAVPVLVNILVLLTGIAGTWFSMQGDIGNAKIQINGISATLSAQIVRIDAMVKEQERVTRLEERLGSITNLLQEIRADLRDGRYAFPKAGVTSISPTK